jgi:hypothetical protein
MRRREQGHALEHAGLHLLVKRVHVRRIAWSRGLGEISGRARSYST